MLPVGTQLGTLRMMEVYDYHDGPRLFACANNAEQFYFVYWYDQTNESEQWLYVPVSVKRLAEIRRGAVTLRHALLKPEDNVLFSVEIKGKQATCVSLAPQKLDPETLPDPDDRLQIEASPVETTSTALRVPEARRRLEFDLKLDPKSYRAHELDSRNSANVLLQTQDLINAIAQRKRGEVKTRGKINPRILRESQVALTATRPGSFIFQLAANQTDLFGESLVEDCLSELQTLLETGANKAKLREHVQRLGLRVASKYKAFLIWSAKVTGDLTLSWASARGADYDRTVVVPFATLVAMARSMEEVERELAEVETVQGKITAFDRPQMKFKLYGDDGFIYAGSVLPAALASGVEITIEKKYEATLHVVFEVESVSGRERRLNYLAALTPKK